MGGSVAGISEIELVPPFDDREVVRRLQSSLRQSTSMRAAVAYWCVDHKRVGADLIRCLSGEGYLCVDIHLPTDIDRLCEMVVAGAKVFLYLLSPVPQPGELKSQVPLHLLHPKMLLFDGAGASELWVGSHNWTARALTGVNVEASLRVTLNRDAELYGSSATFLDQVRLKCEPFDPNAVDYYKWLQGIPPEEPILVLELRGSRALLDAHRRLTVFGRSQEDYKNLKNVDKNIVVSLLDDEGAIEVLYEATISDTGHLTGAGVEFDSRVYAAHDGSPRPEIKGPALPPADVLSAASSWATVTLLDELFGATYELPPAQPWAPADVEESNLSVPPEFRNWFARPDRPLVQRAVPRALFERRDFMESESAGMLDANSPLMLSESSEVSRRSTPRVLRRKAVRAKRRSGELFTLSKKRP